MTKLTYTKVAGAWKTNHRVFVKNAGAWVRDFLVRRKIAGVWQPSMPVTLYVDGRISAGYDYEASTDYWGYGPTIGGSVQSHNGTSTDPRATLTAAFGARPRAGAPPGTLAQRVFYSWSVSASAGLVDGAKGTATMIVDGVTMHIPLTVQGGGTSITGIVYHNTAYVNAFQGIGTVADIDISEFFIQ